MKSRPLPNSRIKVGDLVRVFSGHHLNPSTYEVSEIREDGVVSQPAGFLHRWDDIIAVYRMYEINYKCVWQRKN